MRVVFVNNSHPELPHVSALRAREFAEALARRGHRIVLLTRTLRESDSPKPVEVVRAELSTHDWSRPYMLACAPAPSRALQRVRDSRTPRLLRQALIAGRYILGEGSFSDWTAGSRRYWPVLADDFKPDITWGIFGGLDSWVIARGVADAAGVPWAMDVKDSWDVFIHPTLRHLMAKRFSGAAALTANSSFLAEQYAKWLQQVAEVVYSGVGPEWLQGAPPQRPNFHLVLVGGIYDDRNLRRFVRAFSQWLQHLDPHEQVQATFSYAGSDSTKVKSVVHEVGLSCQVDIRGYLPSPQLADLCRSATANAYLWLHRGFHHKLVELLCCRRPIISFPGERAESLALAQSVGGHLSACADEGELLASLDGIRQGKFSVSVVLDDLTRLTWDAQAVRLESVLSRAAIRGGPCAG